MVIIFGKKKFERECNEKRLLIRRHGQRRAHLIMQRLSELDAADTLHDMLFLSMARCHELHGVQKGQLSVNLDYPYRLIFEPANNPVPLKADGGLDWVKVTEICILGVEDTHD